MSWMRMIIMEVVKKKKKSRFWIHFEHCEGKASGLKGINRSLVLDVVSLGCLSQLSADGRKRIGISEQSFQKRNLGMRYTFRRYQVLKLRLDHGGSEKTKIEPWGAVKFREKRRKQSKSLKIVNQGSKRKTRWIEVAGNQMKKIFQGRENVRCYQYVKQDEA